MLIFVELLLYLFLKKKIKAWSELLDWKGRTCNIAASHGRWHCQKISEDFSEMTGGWGSCE